MVLRRDHRLTPRNEGMRPRQARSRPERRRLNGEVLEDRQLLALTTSDLSSGLTALDLAQTLVGPGVSISNVSYTGSNLAGGTFQGGNSEGLGIDSGVMLSSGAIADAAGPNDSENVTTEFGLPGDADLDVLIPGTPTQDATVLEFDFVAAAGTLSFQYVFASEEYNEFVGSPFNDVFAFFLDGENIALIPGTTTPVSINNVNAGLNSEFYNNNSLADLGSPTPFLTQADGFTTTFAAVATLTPGTHHIKLAIADASDFALDSWVFLAEQSFVSGDVDLEVAIIDSPDPAVIQNALTYTLVVTNHGPDGATGVSVEHTLPPNVTFVGATSSQGTVTQAAGVITAKIGALASGATATITVNVIPTELGSITTTATVQAFQVDIAPLNNTASQETTVGLPLLTISDVQVIEGNAGTSNAVFAVSANGILPNTAITFSYATFDVTANGGSDYVPVSGVVTFSPGDLFRLITVPIVGDIFNEGTETFLVQLLDPVNAELFKSPGIGTIIDNDRRPELFVNDVQVTTTETGTLQAMFTVALDVRSGRDVTVEFSTSDGTAHAGVDYLSQSGVLTFLPGMNTLQVTVPVMTSNIYTPNELFYLNLSNSVNALLGDPLGVCTSVFAPLPPPEYFIDDGDPGYSRSSGWTNVTNLIAYEMDYDYHAPGNGSGTATWTIGNLLPGQYQVFTRWSHFSNRATNAPYTILDGGSPLTTVLVNQQLPTTGDWDNGITWFSLGTFQINNNVLQVRLSDNANGFVTADAVRIVPDGIGPQTPEIDLSNFDTSIANQDASPTFEDGTTFGDVLATTDSLVHTFTIRNTGNADLHLTGAPRVQMSGDHPGDFVVTRQPAEVVAPGRTTSFDVIFHPTTTGARRATVTILSDDLDESLYEFVIEGNGTDGPIGPVQNLASPLDVNADSTVSAFDALLVINSLLRQNVQNGSPAISAQPLAATAAPAAAAEPSYYLDVDGNGIVSARDALLVINHLIAHSTPASSSSPAGATTPPSGSSTKQPTQVFLVDQSLGQPSPAAAVDASPPVTSKAASGGTRPSSDPKVLSPENVESAFAAADEHEADDELEACLDEIASEVGVG